MVVAGSGVFQCSCSHYVPLGQLTSDFLFGSASCASPSQTGPRLDSATSVSYPSFLQTRDSGFPPQVLPFNVDQCSLRLLLKFASWRLVCAFPYIPTPSGSGSVASDTPPTKFFDSGFSSFPSFAENGAYIFVSYFIFYFE